MKRVGIEGLLLLLRVLCVIEWLETAFDTWVACCRPDPRFGTYVWHEHRFLGLRWLSSHTNDLASHQLIPGNAETLRASGEHIHAVFLERNPTEMRGDGGQVGLPEDEARREAGW